MLEIDPESDSKEWWERKEGERKKTMKCGLALYAFAGGI